MGGECMEGDCMGRLRDSIVSRLDSLWSRRRGGAPRADNGRRSALVHLAAARVAGATENRRPICTVALLSVLSSRRWRPAKSGGGLVKKLKLNASLTSVTDLASPRELRRVWRRTASLENLLSPAGFDGE